jgi:hypothetical protein
MRNTILPVVAGKKVAEWIIVPLAVLNAQP